jgi:reductive dehalogenase
MFRRARYDPKWIERAEPFYGPNQGRDEVGYTQDHYALMEAAWYVEDSFAKGTQGSNHEGLYAWESADPEIALWRKVSIADPGSVTKKVKRAARFFGASLAGVCELDRRWVYSHVSDDIAREHKPLEVPEEFRYAIAMAIEMDYGFMQTAPAGGGAAATGLGYSKMAFVAGLLAEFVRRLGYKAIPCGNDTALSVPIAAEAGLGEMGRNGLLITEEFGPRVRLCKVLTDMPLVPDEPRFFGVTEFCEVCMKCADHCPSRAIPFGERTTEAPTISNNSGVLKWPVNAEQCFKFWISNRLDCANCIRVCPFNQPEGWHHDLVRAVIKRTKLFNQFFLWFDGLAGHDRQRDPATIWEG